MDDEEFDDLIALIQRRIRRNKNEAAIRGELLSSTAFHFTKEDLDTAFEEITRRSQAQWVIDEEPAVPALLSEELHHDHWYTGPDPNHCPRWTAVRNGLVENFSSDPSAVESIDTTSTHIVSLLAAPNRPEFQRLGLVVGYVQSGKTTSFTAVAAKAMDAGYKLLIVLAGLNNNLRQQTQTRLNEDLTFHGDPAFTPYWRPLTDDDSDFPRSPTTTLEEAVGPGDATAYAVVKKNSTRLGNLHRFLAANPKLTARTPILLIDDEADQASVDTSDAEAVEERTKINEWILKILGLGRVSYVGYTATPFANFFVDPRFQETVGAFDIYPRHFIYPLPEPGDAYFGTKRLFGSTIDPEAGPEDDDSGAGIVNHVTDIEAKEVRNVSTIGAHPHDSLIDATEYFVMAAAARVLRGQGDEHTTMLVHTSQRVAVHEKLFDYLTGVMNRIRDRVRSGDTDRLRAIWDNERNRFDPEHRGPTEEFDEILAVLSSVLESTEVLRDNSESDERLAYDGEAPRPMIVVGGNTLSRGLTLKGLIVSYFVRPSSTFDTLLQMGRWFGYREGYADLPRIWMTEKLEEHFEFLAHVESELRADIARYGIEGDVQPAQLAPRILAHPKLELQITAKSKMQYAAIARADFGSRSHQTTHFDISDAAALKSTISRTGEFIKTCTLTRGGSHDLGTALVVNDVDPDLVTEYLSNYPFNPAEGWSRQALQSYMVEQTERGLRWNVAVIGSTTDEFEDTALVDGVTIRPWNRSRFRTPADETGEPITNADLGVLRNAPSDEVIDITLDPRSRKLTRAEIITRRAAEAASAQHALLAIYPVAARSTAPVKQRNSRKVRVDLGAPENLIGLMAVFPARKRLPGDTTDTYWSLRTQLLDADPAGTRTDGGRQPA